MQIPYGLIMKHIPLINMLYVYVKGCKKWFFHVCTNTNKHLTYPLAYSLAQYNIR